MSGRPAPGASASVPLEANPWPFHEGLLEKGDSGYGSAGKERIGKKTSGEGGTSKNVLGVRLVPMVALQSGDSKALEEGGWHHGHSPMVRTKDIHARFDFSHQSPRTDRPPRAGNQERLHQAQNATALCLCFLPPTTAPQFRHLAATLILSGGGRVLGGGP